MDTKDGAKLGISKTKYFALYSGMKKKDNKRGESKVWLITYQYTNDDNIECAN